MAVPFAIIDERSKEPSQVETHGRVADSGEPRNTPPRPLSCPACHQRPRWTRGFASPAIHPHCHARKVVSKESQRRFSLGFETNDSLDEMICDGLEREEDQEQSVFYRHPTHEFILRPTPAGGVQQ